VTVRLRDSFGWDAMCEWSPLGGRTFYPIAVQRIFPATERQRLWDAYNAGKEHAEIDWGVFRYCYVADIYAKLTPEERIICKAQFTGKKVLWVEA